MSIVKWGVRGCAGAFMLGLALAGPQAVGTASADTGSSSASSGPAKTSHDSAKPAKRVTAAAGQAAPTHRTISTTTSRVSTADTTAQVLGARSTARTTALRVAHTLDTTTVAGAQPAAIPAANPPITTASSTGTALPGSADPLQDLIDGVVLLIRRTFFNQAPTVNPIQITGQEGGPITGTIGAVDPEGDTLQYTLTNITTEDGQPRYGTVVIDSNGNFTYTPGDDFTGTDTIVVEVADTGLHINLLDFSRPASVDTSLQVSQFEPCTGSGCLTFTFNYGEGADYWTPAARAALEAAAKDLASYLVVTKKINLTYAVTGEYVPNSDHLATGGSSYYSADVFNETVAQHKILTGIDENGSGADGQINWDFAYPYAYDGDVSDNEIDFETTAEHEILHSMGFLSAVGATGSSEIGSGNYSVFDSFMVTSSGVHPISGDGDWNSAYDANLTGGNGGLYFGGANAVAANGGLVRLFTPSTFWAASLSHLSGTTYVMGEHAVWGPGATLGPVELGILEDLGYTISPEALSAQAAATQSISL